MQQIRNYVHNKKTPNVGRLLICNPKLVLRVGQSFHEIRDEIARWRDILTVPYQEHLLRM